MTTATAVATTRERRGWKVAAYYVAVAVAATLLGAALLGFFSHGLGTPVSYSGDTLLTSASIKGIIDNGQAFTNPLLAAPGTSTLFDFPGAESFFLAEIWLLSLLTSDFAVLLNLFVLLSYPLIALAAAWSLRRIGFSRASSFVFALLYTCLPFHQSRIGFHQSLSIYYVIPLAIALVMVVVFRHGETPSEKPGRRFLGLPLWAWFVIVAIGTSGIYYAYFAMALAIVAAVISAWASRDARRLVPAAIIVAGVFVVIFAQMVPSFIYWQQEGRNNLASARVPAESDLYALRMTQLVMPVTGHRVARLAAFKDSYIRSYTDLMGAPFANIAYDSSLGVIGSAGFVILLFWLLAAPFRRPPSLADETPSKLSVLGATCFLLATVGGVGEIVAYLGFPAIRAYDRMTPYIAFLSLAAMAWLADTAATRIRDGRLLPGVGRAAVIAVCFGAVLFTGLYDQTTPATMPRYAEIGPSFESDRTFVAALEAELPDGAMVFQLPYVAFPEAASVEGTGVYDPFRMYLHSATLHWSAGAFRGREDAAWQEEAASLDAPEMLDALTAEGFEGLVIDRDGYADGGAALEAQLATELGDGVLESPDGRFAFYTLAE